ncbi:hypothetical protein HA402_010299 [Bradysia odoriphaga]|nr:hypothetical protein HA402_010299 [Bradysia odoriphaga]
MLKATIRTHENIDIGTFPAVSAYLKSKSSGYNPVKAEVFTEAGIKTFIDTTEDSTWLDVKVICIFGICVSLRTDEFPRITMNDIEKHSDLFLVAIGKTKTKIARSFTINGGFARIVHKYMDLRPERLQSQDRFFTNYQKGKCTLQFIGKNKFASMPRKVAEFLKLPKPERYIGHSFRRTSATFLANSGADMETIMRHGGWHNESCAKGYIEDSLSYKARTGEMIRSSVGLSFCHQ